jgi:hypothetical protein
MWIASPHAETLDEVVDILNKCCDDFDSQQIVLRPSTPTHEPFYSRNLQWRSER